MKFIAYLKLPLSAIRLWFEANETSYTRKEKKQIFKVLLQLRIKEIGERKNTIICQEIFGFQVHAYDYTTLLFLFREIFLSKDYYFGSNQNQERIIDCGANIGMSIFFHKYFHPQAEIIAFEPNPSAFELLQINMKANKLTGVTCIQKAVSENEEPIQFFVNDDKGSLLSSVRSDRGGNKAIHIETTLLSKFLNKPTSLLKIDVEGAEWLILNDLKANAGKLEHVEHVILEYHHKINGEPSKLCSFLSYFEQCGFEYNIRTHYQNQGDFQDLIIHFYR
ncbi:MAG: FkbM family methyltransferase [Bacteroidota bacterium]|nr:FkbM family methyltransferase [Bacteroidota bacterium]